MNSSRRRTQLVALIILIAIIIRVVYELFLRQINFVFPFQQLFGSISTWVINVLAVLIWISIVLKSEYSHSKLPWLLILVIEPFTGVFMFLTFGRDYRESNRYNRHDLLKDYKYVSGEPTTDFSSDDLTSIDSEVTDIYKMTYNMTKHHVYQNDSNVTVLKGKEYFDLLIEKLKSATDFILMQYYIIRLDDIGTEVMSILKAKSNEGVKVKLMFDSLGSYRITNKYKDELKECGIDVVEIDPVKYVIFDTRVNYRNHRKQVIIDSQYGFIGGMNLADEYYKDVKGFPHFRDTSLMLEGSVVDSLTRLFFRDYYSSTSVYIEDLFYYKAEPVNGNGLVQIVPSGPDFKIPPIRNMYVKLINNAKKSIKIMTPYLALDHEMKTSLIIAARGGVDVSIIIPGDPDKKMIYELTQSFIEELLSEGVKVYKSVGTFTHAKILIMDDLIASCGTYNLDNRSARINFEATVLMYEFGVKELVDDFNQDLKNTEEIVLEEWKKRKLTKRLIEGLMSLASPLA